MGAPSASFTQLNATVPVDDARQGNGFREWGKVYIYAGSRKLGLSAEPVAVIETQDDLTGLGVVLSSADLDQDGHADVVIGCPWSSFKVNVSISDADSINTGSLLVFHSSNERKPNAMLDARADASLAIDGAGYEWLGQSTLLIRANATGTSQCLAVGAPGHRNSTAQLSARSTSSKLKRGRRSKRLNNATRERSCHMRLWKNARSRAQRRWESLERASR